jgi:ABC-type lipoprotein release transport system permease subunit
MVVILAIAVGLTGGIFIAGMMNGMVAKQTSNAINNEISDIQIHHPKYLENTNPKYLINNLDEKLETIKSNPEVTSYSYRTKAVVMARTASKGAGVTILGINPELEKTVTAIHEQIIKGDYFETETRSQPIVVGEKLANKLNVDLGKKIIMEFTTLELDQVATAFRVVGIYKTNDTRFDEMNVFVLQQDLNDDLGISGNQANEIALRTTNQDIAPQVTADLSKAFPSLSIQSWREIKPSLIVMLTMMDQFSVWLIVIILFALIFGIINTMLMVIMERKKELGMLMSVGMNKRRVFKMILFETSMLSLTGAGIGLAASIGLISWLSVVGINLGFWAEGLEAVGYSAFVYPYVSNTYYLNITILTLFTAIIASFWPTRKALKMNPAEAVRAE